MKTIDAPRIISYVPAACETAPIQSAPLPSNHSGMGTVTNIESVTGFLRVSSPAFYTRLARYQTFTEAVLRESSAADSRNRTLLADPDVTTMLSQTGPKTVDFTPNVGVRLSALRLLLKITKAYCRRPFHYYPSPAIPHLRNVMHKKIHHTDNRSLTADKIPLEDLVISLCPEDKAIVYIRAMFRTIVSDFVTGGNTILLFIISEAFATLVLPITLTNLLTAQKLLCVFQMHVCLYLLILGWNIAEHTLLMGI